MFLRVGTRGSRLSLAQTDLVVARLREARPDLRIVKEIITTKGDVDQTTPLFSLDQKGIFEKEIDQAVLDGRVDFAVHSMKDIPVFGDDSDLVIAGVPKKGPPADVLVSSHGEHLEGLLPRSNVGTSSLLRMAQLKRVRPDLETSPIRGNVETRIRKVEKGEYDAVILAEAGLARLGLTGKIAERLPLRSFMPVPGQGALAIVALRDNLRVIQLLKTVEHPSSRAQAEAERELVRILEGGCKVPIGALATTENSKLTLTACVLSADGKERLEAAYEGALRNPKKVGAMVAGDLLRKGAKKLEEEWRNFSKQVIVT